MNSDLDVIKDLIKEHGTQAVLETVSTTLKEGEQAIRETHDQRLGAAFDYVVVDLVNLRV